MISLRRLRISSTYQSLFPERVLQTEEAYYFQKIAYIVKDTTTIQPGGV